MAEGITVKRQPKTKDTSAPSKSRSNGAKAPKPSVQSASGASALEMPKKSGHRKSTPNKSASKLKVESVSTVKADTAKASATKSIASKSSPSEVEAAISVQAAFAKTRTKSAGKTASPKAVADKSNEAAKSENKLISAKPVHSRSVPKIEATPKMTTKPISVTASNAEAHAASTAVNRAQEVVAKAEKPPAVPKRKAVATKVQARPLLESSVKPASRRPTEVAVATKATSPKKAPAKQSAPAIATSKSAPKAAAAKTGGRRSGTAAGT